MKKTIAFLILPITAFCFSSGGDVDWNRSTKDEHGKKENRTDGEGTYKQDDAARRDSDANTIEKAR